MKPGIYPGMSWGDYFALDALNHSILKEMGRSPAHARRAQTLGTVSTAAQEMGTAKHTRILEPEEFNRIYLVAPESDKRRKAFKDFVKENPTATVLTPREHDAIEQTYEAVMAHEIAGSILKSGGKNEVTVISEREGLLCKGRFDGFRSWDGFSVVFDIKNMSCDLSNPWAVRRYVRDYKVHSQAAWYLDLANAVAPHERRHLVIGLEQDSKAFCTGVKVLEIDENDIADGRIENDRNFSWYLECKRTDSWPGYPNEIERVSLQGEAV